MQELNLWSQDSHLFCCRSAVAEHEEAAAVVFCGGTRHAHGARKAHSSSARGWKVGNAAAARGGRETASGSAGRLQASSLRKWGAVCGVHGLMALRFSVSPAHQSEAAGASRSYDGCLTQRRRSFRSKKKQQKKVVGAGDLPVNHSALSDLAF